MKLWMPLLGVLALAACGPPTADVAPTFQVAHTTPHHGAVEVEVDVVPIVAFSAPVLEGSVGAISLSQRESGATYGVEITRFLGDEGLTVQLVPRRSLEANAEFVLQVTQELQAEDGSLLAAPYRTWFFTGDDD